MKKMASKLEYLKRYMSKEDLGEEKVKKKKHKKRRDPGGFRIIDRDFKTSFDINEKENKSGDAEATGNTREEDDRFALIEEMPQVAGVIDHRPAEMTGKWKSVQEQTHEPSFETNKSSQMPKSRRRHDSSSEGDNSPPRKSRIRHNSSPDISPPRARKRHDSSEDDISPPRSNKRHDSSSDSNGSSKAQKSKFGDNRQENDSDNSPPRRSKPRAEADRTRKNNSDSDNSPPRQRNRDTRNSEQNSDSDNSPPRRGHTKQKSDSDNSPPRVKDKSSLMKKTLDGKKAGLQNAKALRSEMDNIRNEERKRMEGLSAEVSGKGAKTKVRGKLKEKEEEEQRRKAEAAISEQTQEQYARWGKG